MQLDFNDFDAYKAAAHGWGLEFVQLDRGSLSATLKIAQSDRILIVNTTLNRAFHQQGEAPLMGRTFGLNTRPSSTAEVRWLNQQFEDNTLAIFPSDRAYEAHSAPGKDILAVTIEQSLLEEVSETAGLQRVIDKLPPFGSIYNCRADDIAKLRYAVEVFLQNSHVRMIAGRSQEFDLAHVVLQALAQGRTEQRRPTLRVRDRAFTASINVIREASNDILTIPDLCKAVGVSERTLRYAFREKIGVSPKTYLTAVRLNQVRSQLLQASGQKPTVSTIALDQGFWHMGQFAADYRRMFGEKPSDTLQR